MDIRNRLNSVSFFLSFPRIREFIPPESSVILSFLAVRASCKPTHNSIETGTCLKSNFHSFSPSEKNINRRSFLRCVLYINMLGVVLWLRSSAFLHCLDQSCTCKLLNGCFGGWELEAGWGGWGIGTGLLCGDRSGFLVSRGIFSMVARAFPTRLAFHYPRVSHLLPPQNFTAREIFLPFWRFNLLYPDWWSPKTLLTPSLNQKYPTGMLIIYHLKPPENKTTQTRT